MATQSTAYYTPEQYLELERKAEYKSEYLSGQIFAMAGASIDHNIIAFNFTGMLWSHLRGGSCRGYTSDTRVRVSPTGLFTYPDLTVVCGEPSYLDDRRDTLLNPSLIVEILSPSTEAYDRGEKFAHYETLDSLREYVLVSQHKARIETYVRTEDCQWLYTSVQGIESNVQLVSVSCSLALSDVYNGVEFRPADSEGIKPTLST
jgi:Uma2 family endonuclease